MVSPHMLTNRACASSPCFRLSKAQAVARPCKLGAGFMPGQASMELIIVLGMSLIILLVFVTLSSNLLTTMGVQKNFNDAYGSVQRLAYAADSVYSQGDGAWMAVSVTIPPNTNMSSSATYVGKPSNAAASIPSTLISMRIGGSDIFAGTKEIVAGSFPASPGTYQMRVVSKGSYVAIGTYFFDVDKQAIYKSMAQNEWRAENVTFIGVSNESVSIAYTYNFNYANVGITVSPASPLTVSPGATQSIALNFTPNGNAAGIYNGQLIIVGTSGTSGVVETFSIPITIDVQN